MKRVTALCVLLAIGMARAARGDTASEAAFFDGVARKEYQQAHFSAALDGFLHVHALTPSAGSLYNVALCAELAHEPALAFAFLERYMRANDDDPARPADAARRLQALRSRLALVEVVSEPPGAEITVDRAELGLYGETPRTVVVDPGEHVVMAALRGFRTARATVKAAPNAAAKIVLTLEPILGDLRLTLSPPGATLVAERDGIPVELPIDRDSLRVQIGRYTLRIEAPDHAPAEISVTVTEGSPAEVALVAPPLPRKTGQLLVDTGRDVARLFVDGKAIGLTPATLRDVPEGPHEVRVVAAGRAPWSATVRVKEREPAYVNVTLVDAKGAR